MTDPRILDSLNERFALPGVIRFETGSGGLLRAAVTLASAEGHVYLHGAQVTRYRPTGHQDVLFLSERSHFAPGKAIRGGVPVIFPWFGARAGDPHAPDHGFARTSEWTVESVERPGDDSVAVTLALGPDEATRRSWAHEFQVRQRVLFGAHLEMTLEVENRSRETITLEEALHTYLRVGDVRQASVTGLGGVTYIDKTDGMKRKVLAAGALRLTGRTDRVFLDTRGTCAVMDPVLGRRLLVEKSGSATTVVWNPWSEMADLGPGAWRSMLCVETANATDNALHLASGDRHRMGVVIRVTTWRGSHARGA
jgi:glucose-6-phosphate 1-epimerase